MDSVTGVAVRAKKYAGRSAGVGKAVMPARWNRGSAWASFERASI